MSNPYQQPVLSGYNASPPPDDDSQVSANAVEWQKHLDKIGDPLKTFAQAIDTNIFAAFGKIFGANITSQAGNYTLLATDQGKFLEFTAEATFTLLAAATAGTGFTIAVVNTGGGTVTIDGDSSETINGNTTLVLAPMEGAILTCDGSKWIAVVNSQFVTRVTAQLSDYTVVESDNRSMLTVNGAVTITLPAAATAGNGFTLIVKNINTAFEVTIDADSSETISGFTTQTLGPLGASLLVCDGSKWETLFASPASQSIQEAGTNQARMVVPAVQHYHQSAAKAWVNINGTGSPADERASYNVSSVDDDGVGDYGVNLSVTFASAQGQICPIVGHAQADTAGTAFSNWGHGVRVWPSSTTTIEVECFGNADDPTTAPSRADYEYVFIAIFGNID